MEYPGIFDGNLLKVKSEKIFRILNGKAAMEAKGMFKRGFVNDLRETGIQQYKTDVGFRTLVESVNENLYIIPKYQRKYRWTKDQVDSLVESLIYGLPIPPIYTCRNSENQLEILDGQQRIMSLFFYYIGYYLDNRKNSSVDFSEIETENRTFKEVMMEKLALEELHIQSKSDEGKWVNLDYKDLSLETKRRVDYTTITVIEIKIDNEKLRSSILRQIFANLNKGGSELSEQEQRNGIYNCAFYDMLHSFNRHDAAWRKLWGRESANERDMETLLRFCALKKYVDVKENASGFDFVIDGYNASYGKLLDHFSEEAMEFDETQIMEYKNSLTEFLTLFAVNTTQSSKVALLESFYIVYEKLKVHEPITSQIYNNVLKNPKYVEKARQGTVKMKSMNERWKTVYAVWTGKDQ